MKRIILAALALLLAPCAALALSDSASPPKFNIPWGNSAGAAYIRSIPQGSQIGIQNCAASLTDGFPPLTFVPQSAGGCPPFGADFNGILNQVSAWSRWLNAGAPVFYDGAFSSAIGGYPKGTILSAATFGNFWLSTVDNNTSNPDTGGGNWSAFTPVAALSGAAAGTYLRPQITVNQQGITTAVASGTYPTYTTLKSGSGTYSTPAGAKRLKIRMIAAGGGAGGNGTTGQGSGGTGGNSTFGSTTSIGGSGGTPNSGVTTGTGGNGGTGGTTGSGSEVLRLGGHQGSQSWGSPTAGNLGAIGGASPFGGFGLPSQNGTLANATPNTGSGGGAVTSGSGSFAAGGGGGSGEYVEFVINNPLGAYSYAVGGGGTGGTTGAGGGLAGGGGGSGVLIIEEDYD